MQILVSAEQLVEEARSRQVDAVVLAGDVVDDSNAFFEALGPLEAGARRLNDAGIPLYAVAGNHDFSALPRLAAAVDGFHLLGADGNWEVAELSGADGQQLQLVGWSYPGPAVRTSPLPALAELELADDVPCLGVLHADLGGGDARYCPVEPAAFEACRIRHWLLGHIHVPSPPPSPDTRTSLFYPGSPQGLEPGENSVHGPWLISFDAGATTYTQLPLAPVRYEVLTIDISGVADAEELPLAVATDVRDALALMCEMQPALACLSVRLELTGRSSLTRDAIRRAMAEATEDWRELAGVALSVDRVRIATTPAHDFAALARAPTPLGAAAALALALRPEAPPSADTDAANAAVDQLRSELQRTYRARAFSVLDDPVPDAAACRQLLLDQAMRLVDVLAADGGVADG
jgi:DNA repair exonuclease SbcCD nuclease subunit